MRSAHRSTRSITVSTAIAIRPAHAADATELASLAALDSARALAGDVLVAEADGRLVAALEQDSGRAVADPFLPTADVVALLRLHAELVRSPARRPARLRPLPRTA
jgi:hypothetical protein